MRTLQQTGSAPGTMHLAISWFSAVNTVKRERYVKIADVHLKFMVSLVSSSIADGMVALVEYGRVSWVWVYPGVRWRRSIWVAFYLPLWHQPPPSHVPTTHSTTFYPTKWFPTHTRIFIAARIRIRNLLSLVLYKSTAQNARRSNTTQSTVLHLSKMAFLETNFVL